MKRMAKSRYARGAASPSERAEVAGYGWKRRPTESRRAESSADRIESPCDRITGEMERKSVVQAKGERLRGGRKSMSVMRLPTGVVQKRYDPRRPAHVWRFHHEVSLLRHLQGCPFVPTLVSVDEDRFSFKISDCGRPVRDTPRMRRLVDRMLRCLEKDYGVYRIDNVGKPMYRVGTMANVLINKAGQIFIIDFGSRKFQLRKQATPQPSPHADSNPDSISQPASI